VVLDAGAGPGRDLGVIVTGTGAYEFRQVVAVELDKEHDLAHLRITGKPLPALALGDSDSVAEGHTLAFTGFPLGMAFGLNPATHRAMLAAVAPAIMPSLNARSLDARIIGKLVSKPFDIFQLDGTAYPGNSGSPLYRGEDGKVIGILNMVWVKNSREAATGNPSGISYAIPSNFIRDLVKRQPSAPNQERKTP
jgi:S1-C subfamily serine protease